MKPRFGKGFSPQADDPRVDASQSGDERIEAPAERQAPGSAASSPAESLFVFSMIARERCKASCVRLVISAISALIFLARA
jgi:hypothetical protein